MYIFNFIIHTVLLYCTVRSIVVRYVGEQPPPLPLGPVVQLLLVVFVLFYMKDPVSLQFTSIGFESFTGVPEQ